MFRFILSLLLFSSVSQAHHLTHEKRAVASPFVAPFLGLADPTAVRGSQTDPAEPDELKSANTKTRKKNIKYPARPASGQ